MSETQDGDTSRTSKESHFEEGFQRHTNMEDDNPETYVNDLDVMFTPERPSTKRVIFRGHGKHKSRNRQPQQLYKWVAVKGKEEAIA
ncbi:hypothetical protein PVK06_026679 [Gossypium arboreum]|uniref:Uncharacterized protein n=1 Tax=Gossypium arboreum TaxID=29729 RepID=A0ABR0NYC6_GOSAR|nr:hypothetical protein PVK06_026679 [Gossypium arboreum]